LSQILDEELDRLPERFRRVAVLCYLEGHSTAEAARRLGCPRGTVLSRLATAREKLRVRLVRRGVAPAVGGLTVMANTADAPAALVAPAVRAAVAGTATPRVIELCDGVLRTMMLSKLKLTTAMVLTVGLIGGGAGWVTLTPGGPGIAHADGPPAKAKPVADPEVAEREAEDARNQKVGALRDNAQADLLTAQDKLAIQEEKWAQERIHARVRVAEAEERYKQLERYDVGETAEAKKRLHASDVAMNLERQIVQAQGDKRPTEDLQKKLAETLDIQTRAQHLCDKKKAELADQIVRARRDLVSAEEQLSLLDRHINMKRRSAQALVDEAQDRLSQLRGAASRIDPAERRNKDVDRKLDDVLHELTELRREMKK
jgi:hypothetical protein